MRQEENHPNFKDRMRYTRESHYQDFSKGLCLLMVSSAWRLKVAEMVCLGHLSPDLQAKLLLLK